MVFSLPTFYGCNNNRPTFPEQEQQFPNSSSNISTPNNKIYNTLNLCDGVEAKSINLQIDSGKYYVKNGSDVKFSITYPKYTSTSNEVFYFNKTTNKIIYGININDSIVSNSELDNYFAVSTDITVSLIESNLSLSAIMLCEKYSNAANDTIYKKFNYKSNNFRNSLISTINNNIIINNQVNYIIFDNKQIINSNVSKSFNYHNETKTLNLKIGAYLETTDIAFVLIYKDSRGNLFLSDVQNTNKISSTKNSPTTNIYSTIDNNIIKLEIEFASYYDPSMIF